ncbi:MAG: hypothetical protein RR996_02400, partial [Alistipes sp.]
KSNFPANPVIFAMRGAEQSKEHFRRGGVIIASCFADSERLFRPSVGFGVPFADTKGTKEKISLCFFSRKQSRIIQNSK